MKTWSDASNKWILETKHKKDHRCDRAKLRWIGRFWNDYALSDIKRDLIDELAQLKALTAKQIQEGLQKGKVDMGGHEEAVQTVDAEAAVTTALEAFSDGLFLAIIDGQEQTSPDAVLTLTETSQVAFVRLTMLAGG